MTSLAASLPLPGILPNRLHGARRTCRCMTNTSGLAFRSAPHRQKRHITSEDYTARVRPIVAAGRSLTVYSRRTLRPDRFGSAHSTRSTALGQHLDAAVTPGRLTGDAR